jgi:hypothetical protein
MEISKNFCWWMSIRQKKNTKPQNYCLALRDGWKGMSTVTCSSRKSFKTRASTRAFVWISIGRKTVNWEQQVREVTQEDIRFNVLESRRDFNIKFIYKLQVWNSFIFEKCIPVVFQSEMNAYSLWSNTNWQNYISFIKTYCSLGQKTVVSTTDVIKLSCVWSYTYFTHSFHFENSLFWNTAVTKSAYIH